MSNTSLNKPNTSHFREIGPGFYNLRAPFTYVFGLIDAGAHMSLIRLSSGKFLAVSTVELSPEAKRELDELTDNGKMIEAVLGTHPFHTLAFRGFYKMYPNAKYYGTPRHLRNITEIPW
jgi:hypothetical protein